VARLALNLVRFLNQVEEFRTAATSEKLSNLVEKRTRFGGDSPQPKFIRN